jgi:hypothetical protein
LLLGGLVIVVVALARRAPELAQPGPRVANPMSPGGSFVPLFGLFTGGSRVNG